MFYIIQYFIILIVFQGHLHFLHNLLNIICSDKQSLNWFSVNNEDKICLALQKWPDKRFIGFLNIEY